IFHKSLVYITIGTIGQCAPSYRWNGIDYLAKLSFASAQFGFAVLQGLLGALRVVNVEINPHPTQYSSIARSKGLGATQEPMVLPFSVTNSKAHLAGATRA